MVHYYIIKNYLCNYYCFVTKHLNILSNITYLIHYNKSSIERLTTISTNTLLNYSQRYCVIYLCNNELFCLFLEHKLIMVSVRLQMCKEYLNGHQGVHIGQYSVLIVFLFNPFVYYYILSHTRPIMTNIYATVDYSSDLNHIHSSTINVKLSFLRSCIISNPTFNDLFNDHMNDMLLIIVKNNIQILYVTHMLYLKYILLHFIYACTYSHLLATQKPFSITRDEINTVKMQSHCTIVDWRQWGKSLALCYFAVVMELPDSLLMKCKSEFGVIFLRCSTT